MWGENYMKLRDDLQDLAPYTAGKKAPGALKLSSNENPLGPSPLAMESIKSSVGEIHIYPEGTSAQLRGALAARDGLDPSQYLVGNGSDEVLTMIAGAFINPGDRGLTAVHTFSEYNFAVRLFGGKMDFFDLNQGALDLKSAQKCLTSRHRMVFLCNPNNPTGGYFNHESLEEFLAGVPSDLLVVVDEAYREYSTAGDFPRTLELLKTYPNLLITRTFSKIYGLAALRVGYAVGAPGLIRDISVVKQPFNVGTLNQGAALAALGDESFLHESLEINAQGKKFWYKSCEDLGLVYYPTQANFLAIKVPKPAKEIFTRMIELGVAIRPLDSFGLPGWIRITIGSPEQNQKCLAAFKISLND